MERAPPQAPPGIALAGAFANQTPGAGRYKVYNCLPLKAATL